MFENYVVVITGAASGIGLGIAKNFLQKGAVVIAVDYDEAALQAAAEENGANYVPKRCDVSNGQAVATLSDSVGSQYGRIDVLVNNAGRSNMKVKPEAMKDADFNYHYDVLVKGAMLMVKYFAPLLRQSSNPSIVNISSVAAISEKSRDLGDVLYATCKVALVKFNRHLVRCLPGIRSNVIMPGSIETSLFRKSFGVSAEEEARVYATMARKMPRGRIGNVEDIASCIAFLSSEDSTFINGAEIPIDCGHTISIPEWDV